MSNLLWGQSTWFLFHTLAEKVKDEEFSTIKLELIGLLITIVLFLLKNNLVTSSCLTDSETATTLKENIENKRIKNNITKSI